MLNEDSHPYAKDLWFNSAFSFFLIFLEESTINKTFVVLLPPVFLEKESPRNSDNK